MTMYEIHAENETSHPFVGCTYIVTVRTKLCALLYIHQQGVIFEFESDRLLAYLVVTVQIRLFPRWVRFVSSKNFNKS